MGNQEIRIPFKGSRGVDLVANARLEGPDYYLSTENMYARLRGTLEKRPGSQLISRTVTPRTIDDLVPSGFGTAESFITRTGTPTKTYEGLTSGVFIPDSLKAGPPWLQPFIKGPNLTPEDDLVPTTMTTGAAGTASMKVSALAKIYPYRDGKGYWIGAMNSERRDFLWWLNTSNQMQLLPTANGMISSAHANWQIIPFRVGVGDFNSNGVATKGGVAIVNNTIDKPIILKLPTSTNANQPLGAYSMNIAGQQYPTRYIFNCQAIAKFGRQIVYGGFMLGADDGSAVDTYRNAIAFGDPDEPWSLASDTNGIYTIIPGLDINDNLTALSASGYITDGSGPRGQLVCFTRQHVFVYEGLPPVSDNPPGSDFGVNNIAGDVGCVSPKTIVRTHYGVFFLGTDGIVYLISLDNRIVPVSRALEPHLGGRILRAYQQACAWYENGFYKLSYPESEYGPFNTIQAWGDVRSINLGDPHDANIQWYWPMRGQNVHCVGVSRDLEDRSEVYAGMSHLMGLFQVGVPDLYSDVDPNDLSTTKNINFDVTLGDNDVGEAHQDKTCKAVSLGITLNHQDVIECTVSALSGTVGQPTNVVRSKTIDPAAQVLGSGFILNGSAGRLSGDTNYALPTFQDQEVVRGRTFRIRFRETSSSPTFARIANIEMRIAPVERRATDNP